MREDDKGVSDGVSNLSSNTVHGSPFTFSHPASLVQW